MLTAAPDAITASAPAAEGSPYRRHIPALDGVRALAVTGVMASHLFPGNASGRVAGSIRSLFSFGATGVDLFFVLSGFLITGILFDSLAETGYFRKFYARRALRIFPLYYGVLAAFFIYSLVAHVSFRHELLSCALYLQNTHIITTPLYDYVGPPTLPLTHFWSLALEEQFYLCWPLLVFLLRKRETLLRICLLGIVLAPVLRFILFFHGVSLSPIHDNVFCRADALFAGGWLALSLRGTQHDLTLRRSAWLSGLGFVAAVAARALLADFPATLTPSSLPGALLSSLQYTALAATYTGLMALAMSRPFLTRFFSLAPLRWIGKYSYGLYVYHLILFGLLEARLRPWIAAHVTASKPLGVLLGGVFLIAISVAVAYLSFNLYEKPFLRLKRFFDYRPRPGITV